MPLQTLILTIQQSDITLNNITDVAGNAPVFTADRVVLAIKVEYTKTGSHNPLRVLMWACFPVHPLILTAMAT
ncbi:MAG: hypothetical protein H0A76_10010 [Candidatus Thiodubiliella endoseptemdiera]|uniref:Uncharacterized protein n=1 Tax=Candidatus Thiodubiliella endoseptemdiera TaxID=2738886 RepID=A0A853F593_9GAMM|nr:hypothetical protein [Candidatus Thiodubiliella endoseptemdiera]